MAKIIPVIALFCALKEMICGFSPGTTLPELKRITQDSRINQDISATHFLLDISLLAKAFVFHFVNSNFLRQMSWVTVNTGNVQPAWGANRELIHIQLDKGLHFTQ